MPKQARVSRIKSLRCYTVDEAAETVGISARTVRSWIADGLPVMKNDRPMLIRGDALRAFVEARRSARKISLAPDAFYCLSCRAARHPAEGFAECQRKGPRLMLTALCEVCETVMHKPVGEAQLAALRTRLDIVGENTPPPPAPAHPKTTPAPKGATQHIKVVDRGPPVLPLRTDTDR